MVKKSDNLFYLFNTVHACMSVTNKQMELPNIVLSNKDIWSYIIMYYVKVPVDI